MSKRALLIGVDDYDFSPLTSCVNDAVAMRDLLIELKVFAAQECTLMTSPLRSDGVTIPSRNAILEFLKPIYKNNTPLDRKDLDVKVKVGWVKGLNRLYFLYEASDNYWDFRHPDLHNDIFEVVVDGDLPASYASPNPLLETI